MQLQLTKLTRRWTDAMLAKTSHRGRSLHSPPRTPTDSAAITPGGFTYLLISFMTTRTTERCPLSGSGSVDLSVVHSARTELN